MFDDPSISPADVGMNADRLAAIPDFFEANYLKTGILPCMATLVSRNGQIVHEAYRGASAFEGGAPIAEDALFRIYSMTKPVTAVSAMMLFEEGHFRFDQPVSRFIPEFKEMDVWVSGDSAPFETRPAERQIRILDTFLHTTGLTYGFLFQHPIDAHYRQQEIGTIDETLEEQCRRLATTPLLFSPGERWNYGHSTDVLGRIVEIISGQSLADFFQERIFEPLGMVDTSFWVPEAKQHRLPACYQKNPVTGEVTLQDGQGSTSHGYSSPMKLHNAGGGLVSSLRDYHRFCLMLLHGGSFNGARLLSPKTVEFMRQNHLPGGQSIKEFGDKTFSEARMEGNGFGLGGSVQISSVETLSPGSVGTYSWGGLANTFFWIDPEEELIGIQATQMIPSGCYPIRPQFQQLVYAALDW